MIAARRERNGRAVIEAVLAVLGPWRSPALAFAVAVAAAGLARAAPALTGLALALGLLAGLFDAVGVMLVTPRMLPERLPWLVAAATVAGLVLAPVGLGRWGRRAAIAGLAAAAAWWLLGAPREAADLARVAPVAAVLAAGFAMALARWRRGGGLAAARRGGLAALVLAAGLWLAAAPALFVGLAACAAAAAAGTLAAARAASAAIGDAGELALAAAIAGTAAVAALAWPEPGVIAAAALSLALLALGRRSTAAAAGG